MGHPVTGPLLDVTDLHVTFALKDRTVHAVNGVSLSVRRGETLAVIGESGSGKTVTSRAVMGLLSPAARVAGSAVLLGTELIGLTEAQLREHRGRDIAMIFQDPAGSLNPTMKIGRQVTEAVRMHLPLDQAAARARALELLDLVQVPSPRARYDDYPHQFSGGMRQRVMIAIALACGPQLLIADEATTALDVTTQAQIMDLLMDLQDELDMSMIMISHDMGLAATYADRVMVMYAGRVVEHAATERLYRHVRMPYTRALLDAVPRLEREPHSLFATIGGRPPDLTALPPGCTFAPRCPRVQDRCRAERPELTEHETGHHWACFSPWPDERR
ncbi:dipeptide/oligopeptide/nickel ABC transporter ATP-binding protein [Pseudonocardia sp. CNS-139]|nr:dipeptide/oligopeptide/nickel ABC transporter ATP-binding protein [Pseudonocardia sp. CNS-139]